MAKPQEIDYEENQELITQIQANSHQELDFEFLEGVGELAEQRVYHEGEVILREGEYNAYLFFLIAGRVGVYVGGERVSELANRGDLIGEMSVISKRPCSATIRAETQVELIGIPTHKLEHLDPETAKHFSHTMDRIYASILTEKLLVTNEKAKQFEIANRELVQTQRSLIELNGDLERRVDERTQDLLQKSEQLRTSNSQLESQNELLQGSFRKLEEVAGSKSITFSKLTSMYQNVLLPLQKTIAELRERSPDALLDRAHSETKEAVEILQPLTALFSSERAMQSKKVLFIDPELKRQLVARMALGGTGVEVEIAGSFAQAKTVLGAKVFDLIFVEGTLASIGPELRTLQSQAQIVLVSSTQPNDLKLTPEQQRIFTTLVTRDEGDRTFTIKSIMTTAQKLISRDLFGLEKYLAWGVEVQSHSVERSEQRPELVERMQTYFKSMGVRSSLVSRCEIVAEELLMNAIYDAPVDANGRSRYNHMSRKENVILEPAERGIFRFSCDGMLVGVSVTDPFGAFGLEILLRYLESCYQGTENPIAKSEAKGGAGRGLHQIVENSDLVIFNVKPKVRTEVIALFNLSSSRSESTRGPSYHFFLGA